MRSFIAATSGACAIGLFAPDRISVGVLISGRRGHRSPPATAASMAFAQWTGVRSICAMYHSCSAGEAFAVSMR